MASRFIVAKLSMVLAAVACIPAHAEQSKATNTELGSEKGSEFIRVRRDDGEKPISLDTAIVQYVATKPEHAGLTVDLVAAVHVGDRAYYEQLNQLFATYDAVLYELVAPEGTRIPRGGGAGSGHPVSALQSGMKDMLDLTFQLELIDYTKKNLIHADMTPEQFSKSMKDRGETFLQLFFRLIGQGMAMQSRNPSGSSDAQILLALLSKDRAIRLKRILAEQFEDLEMAMLGFEGPNGSTIISERNKQALKVLSQQVGKKKKIAIFYGAGHMPDLEKRLIQDYKMHVGEHRWLPAWRLTKRDVTEQSETEHKKQEP